MERPHPRWADVAPAAPEERAEPSPRRDGERGQGMVEYGLILVLIAVVVTLVLGVVGHQVSNVFSNLSHSIP